MSSTSLITLSLLIKLWILGVTFYVIRATSSEFSISPRNELFCYMATSLAVFASGPMLGFSIVSGGGGRAMEMTRQESDLVKDYLRNRTGGETLGDYLLRVEAEEEQHLQMIDARRAAQRKKRSAKSTGKVRASQF